jgi:hypothetical protein
VITRSGPPPAHIHEDDVARQWRRAMPVGQIRALAWLLDNPHTHRLPTAVLVPLLDRVRARRRLDGLRLLHRALPAIPPDALLLIGEWLWAAPDAARRAA